MMTAEQNYRLLQAIEADRRFLLRAYRQNPQLLERAEARVRELFVVSAQHGREDMKQAKIAKQHGISLVELIMFIVIVSVAVAGILLVMNVTTKSSSIPLVHKQSLAIAESMLEEVELMPFTYCDPDDANATTATAPAGCAATSEGIGPETIGGVTEDRYGGANPAAVNAFFDNVSDYNGFSMAAGALRDITNTPAGPAGYAVTVAVANNAIAAAGGSPAIAAAEALLITVTVTGPDGVPVVVQGIRTRYSPTTTP